MTRPFGFTALVRVREAAVPRVQATAALPAPAAAARQALAVVALVVVVVVAAVAPAMAAPPGQVAAVPQAPAAAALPASAAAAPVKSSALWPQTEAQKATVEFLLAIALVYYPMSYLSSFRLYRIPTLLTRREMLFRFRAQERENIL